MQLFDGRTKSVADQDTVQLCYRGHERPADNVEVLHFVVSNRGSSQAWREIRLGIPLADYQGLTYWDGLHSRRIRKPRTVIHACNADPFDGPLHPLPDKFYPEIYGVAVKGGNVAQRIADNEWTGIQTLCQFPAAALHDDRFCLGLGIDPRSTFSYVSSGIHPRRDGFYCSVKVVLEPGETDVPIDFVATWQRGTFGYRHVLDAYYRAFPDLYRFSPDIDQRLFGPAETFLPAAAAECGDIVLEEFRRFGTSWVLCNFENFAAGGIGLYLDPFILGRKFLDRYQDGVFRGRSFRAANRIIAKGNRSVLRTAGIGNGETFENGALRHMKSRFADSIVIRSNGKPIERHNKMCGDALAADPGGKSYWRFLKTSIARAARGYRPSALYVDNCFGPRPNFHPAIPRLSCRAFTDGQVYMAQGVGHSKVLRQMQSFLHAPGQRMATAANTPGDYMVARHTDVAIVEGGAWLRREGWKKGWPLALRRLMGQKPVVQWGPKGFANWLSMTEEQADPIIDRQVRMAVLFALNTGCLLNTAHAVRGYPDSQKWLPQIVRLARLGWQPVTAARSDNARLELERFGDADFSVVNYSGKKQTATVTLRVIASDGFIPVFIQRNPDRVETSQRIDASSNQLRVEVPPHSAVVLQPVMSLRLPPRVRCGVVVSPAAEGETVVSLTGLRQPVTARFLPEAGHLFASVKVNGRRVAMRSSQDGGWLQCIIKPARSLILTITQEPDIYLADEDLLEQFPFLLPGDRRGFTVVCPEPARAGLRLQVARLRAYFQYYLAHCKLRTMSRDEILAFDKGNHDTRMTLRIAANAPRWPLPCRRTPSLRNRYVILVNGSDRPWMRAHLPMQMPARSGIYNDGRGNLVCYASVPEKLSAVMDRLLSVMDRRFPLVGDQRWRERRLMKAKFWNLHVTG
ncbi:MAG TPA: hypothetical protein DCX07_13995 [Phycisphaerales bacterium]|nr:hypothetical protein [Phycisphaerales bacterium]